MSPIEFQNTRHGTKLEFSDNGPYLRVILECHQPQSNGAGREGIAFWLQRDDAGRLFDWISAWLGAKPLDATTKAADNVGDSDRWEDPRDIGGGSTDIDLLDELKKAMANQETGKR